MLFSLRTFEKWYFSISVVYDATIAHMFTSLCGSMLFVNALAVRFFWKKVEKRFSSK